MEAEEPPPSSLDDSSSRAWLRSTSQTSAGTHAGREEGICSLASNGLAGCVYWPVNYLSVCLLTVSVLEKKLQTTTPV